MTTYGERLLNEGREFEEGFEYSLDAKGRFVFPTSYRDAFETGLFLTSGLDGCLDVWTREGHSQQKLMAARLPVASRNARQIRRSIISGRWVKLDGQHRLTLPAPMRKSFDLEREITIVGNIDHLEIWARELYADYMDDANAARATFDSELPL